MNNFGELPEFEGPETLAQRNPDRVESCIKQHIKYAQEVLTMRIKRIEKENRSESQN